MTTMTVSMLMVNFPYILVKSR